MRATKSEAAEIALREILDVLASILIRLDLTPARLAQMSRASFVKSAAAHARMRSGRPHIARIAARIGLSRTEVKRIASARFGYGDADITSAPRALRVAEAWRSCQPYVSQGKPRALRLAGKSPSFETLCREHSGDIPCKVILDELTSRSLVRLSSRKQCVSLLPRKRVIKRAAELETLIYAAAFLTELAKGTGVLVRRRVRIVAPDKITEKYFERTVASQIGELVDSLPTLFSRRTRRPRRKGGINVYALVSRAK
jgi:hypothetical protein